MVKVRISGKIFISYFILLAVVFTVTSLTFNVLSKRYLLAETRQDLKTEGQKIVQLLRDVPLQESNIREKLLERQKLRIAQGFIEAQIIVTDEKRKILFTNIENPERIAGLKQTAMQDLLKRGLVAEQLSFTGKSGAVEGYIFLISKLDGINALNKLMRRTMLFSLLPAGIVALFIGSLLGRGIANPITQLMRKMRDFSLHGFSAQNNSAQDNTMGKIRSAGGKAGDEIEELACCFAEMADKLKEYDRKQKEFLQDASHELKTPLMSIQGYAEAIKDGVVTGADVEKSLDIIAAESQRLKKIVEEIIYLTKLENVQEIFDFAEKNIRPIIERAVNSVKPLADERHIAVNLRGDLEFTKQFDEARLQRALVNILGNCVRYAMTSVAIEGAWVDSRFTLKISDDGPGFAEGEIPRIFERFYKGEKGGTGIGLAIAKAIIERHGGSIRAFNRGDTDRRRSADGQTSGAVFEIVFS